MGAGECLEVRAKNCDSLGQATNSFWWGDEKNSALTGQAGMQSSQWVHSGSLILIKSPSRSKTSIGQRATHAAQPKHLPSSS